MSSADLEVNRHHHLHLSDLQMRLQSMGWKGGHDRVSDELVKWHVVQGRREVRQAVNLVYKDLEAMPTETVDGITNSLRAAGYRSLKDFQTRAQLLAFLSGPSKGGLSAYNRKIIVWGAMHSPSGMWHPNSASSAAI